MNATTAAEAVVALLRMHGVQHVFGLCGDTSLPLYDALYRDGAGLQHVLTRDERHAAYMADAYARLSGRVGVCEGPSGGGATYLLPGLVEANESSVAVLGITTDISVSARGRFTLTELDQQALMRPLTKWNRVIDTGAALPSAVRTAFAEASSGRPGAVHIGLPLDVQRQPVAAGDVWAVPDNGHWPALRVVPDAGAVARAARELDAARRPLFVCGGGVLTAGAEAELRSLAERLDAPVATTVSGQGSIADSHALSLGVVGSNGGTPATRRVVDDADLIVFVGCRAGSVTTERWRHPAPGVARVVHIDVDPGVMGVNYPTAVSVVGDAKLTLAAIAAETAARARATAGRQRVASARREKRAAFEALAASQERPIRPERVVATLQTLLSPETVVVADPGTPCPYLSAYYEWPLAGRRFVTNRAQGALGFALPAVIGAHFGSGGAPCVAVMGDGSFGMAAGELETLRRLALPVTLLVISNASFGWIKAGQKTSFGERYFSVDFSTTDHAAVARAFGLPAWRVEDPAHLAPALREALAADAPTLVDIVCQPLEQAQAPVSEWIA